jgi:hypothetical protein
MQGPIAQALALTCVGNACLRGEDVSGFWPEASVFRFSRRCEFRELDGDHDALIAADPLAWFETLRSVRGLLLHTAPRPRGPQQTIPISERESVGFVGGGPAWIIEALGAEGSALWQGHDRLGDRRDPERKIWLNTYLRSAGARLETRAQPLGRGMVLQAASRALQDALAEIESLASLIAPAWSETFASARETLNADKPDAFHHADIADYARFSAAQRQILAAVSAAWVFGGMGSWNDMVAPAAHASDYERLSEALFDALIDAICALANSTFDG